MEPVYLSHCLGENTPGYGGNNGIKRLKDRDMECGDSCNAETWTLSNHIGTHVDLPKHFAINGASMGDYTAADWIFENIQLIDLPVEPETLIDESFLSEEVGDDVDLLLLRTGFEKYRGEELYWKSNPGLLPEFGKYLREKKTRLRVIGFDFISLTSYAARDIGRVAHRAFLSPEFEGQPIRIIEDMSLSHLNGKIEKVCVAPLRVENADGAPVTVLGFVSK